MHAERVIDAHRAAGAIGKGVVQLDGKLVEKLPVENVGRIAAKAATILELEGASG